VYVIENALSIGIAFAHAKYFKLS